MHKKSLTRLKFVQQKENILVVSATVRFVTRIAFTGFKLPSIAQIIHLFERSIDQFIVFGMIKLHFYSTLLNIFLSDTQI